MCLWWPPVVAISPSWMIGDHWLLHGPPIEVDKAPNPWEDVVITHHMRTGLPGKTFPSYDKWENLLTTCMRRARLLLLVSSVVHFPIWSICSFSLQSLFRLWFITKFRPWTPLSRREKIDMCKDCANFVLTVEFMSLFLFCENIKKNVWVSFSAIRKQVWTAKGFFVCIEQTQEVWFRSLIDLTHQSPSFFRNMVAR